jgi:hypothetical protein
MRRKFKPLNENQLEVLTLLKRHGWWSLGCSWFCRTRTATRRILENLERRGLAKRVAQRYGSRATAAGFQPVPPTKITETPADRFIARRWSEHPKAKAARFQRWRRSQGLIYNRSERRWILPKSSKLKPRPPKSHG